MEALELSMPQSLDIPGFALVIIGSVLASWTAKKMDKKDEEGSVCKQITHLEKYAGDWPLDKP